MKNENIGYGQSFAIEKTGVNSGGLASPPGAPGRRASALALALSVALAGCVSTPHTTIQGTLNGSPFVIEAPKDGDLTGFDLTADTNGVMRIHIDHLTVKMNPDVIGQTGAAQTAIIQATGEVASGITAAAVAAAMKGQ